MHDFFRTIISNTIMSNSLSVVKLLQRIHRLKVRDEQNIYFHRLKIKSFCLLFTIILLCLSQCHTHVYNALNGPFHLNLTEFITHWYIYNGNVSVERSFLSNLFLLEKKYLQIELGENKIDENLKDVFYIYRDFSTKKNVIYTFNPIKDQNITRLPMQLFVKLPTNLQFTFHQRLPYRFELFSSDTLICISQQINISQEVYYSNWKNGTLIRLIEEIYDENMTDFNMKVISKCGILIGYLYNYPREIVFSAYSDKIFKFTAYVAVFNAYSSYSYYMIDVLGVHLLSYILIIILNDLFHILRLVRYSYCLSISDDTRRTLDRFNIDSIEKLNYLLLNTTTENNYHNQLFLINDQYLVTFQFNLDERNPKILRQFYKKTPFMIINTEDIVGIGSNGIPYVYSSFSDRISPPKINNNERLNWLHRRLMVCSPNYRKDEQKRQRLATLAEEESKIRQDIHENESQGIRNRSATVSTLSIAKFRLDSSQIADIALAGTTCVLCFEDIQSGDLYSQWPCQAQHMFHHICMLNVIRRQNKCPLCRYKFEDDDDSSMSDIDSVSNDEVD